MLLLWEIACRVFSLPATVLPTPTAIGKAMVQYWPAIWQNGLQTLMTTLLGFGQMMLAAQAGFNVELAFAGVMALAILGIALYAITALIEKRFTGWAFRAKGVT